MEEEFQGAEKNNSFQLHQKNGQQITMKSFWMIEDWIVSEINTFLDKLKNHESFEEDEKSNNEMNT